MRSALALILVALLAPAAAAADPSVRVVGPTEAVRLPAGGRAVARIRVEIAKGYHVYGPGAGKDYISLSFERGEGGLAPGPVRLPPAHPMKFPYEDAPIPVYEGTLDAELVLTAPAEWPLGATRAAIVVGWQACTDEVCEDAKKVALEIPLEVVSEPARLPDWAAGPDTGGGAGSGAGTGTGTKADTAKRTRPTWLWQIVGALLGGLLVTLTPCVYPVIPVTISYFQQQAKSRGQAVFLALVYGAGIIAMYATLGVVMARLGRDLGSILGNVYVGWGFVALFTLLALSMFGWYELSLPSSWQTKLQSGERGGALGALLLGLTLGLVAAPCVGPVAGGLMLIVAQTGDLLFGVLAFGAFGLGIALPFMVLGVFSGAIGALPRAGMWMESVKHVFGYVLLAFAIYFVFVTTGSGRLTFALAGAWLLAAGVAALRPEHALARGSGIAFAAAGVYFLFGPYVLQDGGSIVPPAKLFESKIAWQKDHDEALALARKQGKPAMVDFTATWCNACHELDLTTFRDERVVEEARRFVCVKVDVTRDEKNQKIKNEVYKAFTIPYLAFYDSSGRLVATLPREGATGITTEDVLSTMKEIR